MILKKPTNLFHMKKYSQYNIPNSDILIDFSIGQPSNSLLGLDIVKNSLKNISETSFLKTEDILQYSNNKGLIDFRKNLSNWLNCKLNGKTKFTENNLMILNGITGSIQTILESTYYPNDIILVEEATYYLMIDIFRDRGLKIEYIPVNDNGIDFESLSDKLDYLSENQSKIYLYMISFYHNPLGKTINIEEIENLKNLFDVFDNFYVISDEVYYFLDWDKKINNESKDPQNSNILPLAEYHKNFITLGSFSKIIGPSLRLGYILSKNKELLDELEYNSNIISSGGNTVFSSIIVNSMFEKNILDNHLEKVINILKIRNECMINELEKANKQLKKYDISFDYSKPKGGYFILVKLKSHKNIDLKLKSQIIEFIFDECKINKVSFLEGEKFTCSSNDDLIGSFRLSYSYYDVEDIKIGINRIVDTLINIYKVRIVTIGEDELMNEMIKKKLENFDCLEYYVQLKSDCSNIEEVKISKFNKTVFINLTECDKINIFMNRILNNLNNLDEYINQYDGNLMLISKISCTYDDFLLNSYAKSNPVLLVDSYSKNDSLCRNIDNIFIDITEKFSLNSNNKIIDNSKNNLKYKNLSYSLPGLGTIEINFNEHINEKIDDTNVASYIFSILGRNKGVYYFDYNDNNKIIHYSKFLDNKSIILKDSKNYRFTEYISKLLFSENKFFEKVDNILLDVTDTNTNNIIPLLAKDKYDSKYNHSIEIFDKKLSESSLFSFVNFLNNSYYSKNYKLEREQTQCSNKETSYPDYEIDIIPLLAKDKYESKAELFTKKTLFSESIVKHTTKNIHLGEKSESIVKHTTKNIHLGEKSESIVKQNTNNTSKFLIIDDMIYFKCLKSTDIKYNTIDKIKEITVDYDFLNDCKINVINTNKIVVIIDCNCNLGIIDKCVLSFVKSLIKDIIPSSFSIVFVESTNENNISIIDFDKININIVCSVFHYISDIRSISSNYLDNNCSKKELSFNLLNYNIENAKESSTIFNFRKIKNELYVGVCNSLFSENKILI